MKNFSILSIVLLFLTITPLGLFGKMTKKEAEGYLKKAKAAAEFYTKRYLPDDLTDLHIIAAHDDGLRHEWKNALQYFIEKEGRDFMVVDKKGRSPLHYAVGNILYEHTAPEMIKYLLGIDVIDLQDDDGNTALHYASGIGSNSSTTGAAKLLLKYGFDPDLKNHQGLTPRMGEYFPAGM